MALKIGKTSLTWALSLISIAMFSVVHAAEVHIIDLEGGIGPATSSFVVRKLDQAQTRGVELVVIRMDTPGGLVDAMRDIVSGILGSQVPVVTFVTPSGARAASAGTYIAYASHLAAMSPATNIGSSTPVSIGGGDSLPIPGFEDGPGEEGGDGNGGETPTSAPGSAMGHKVINDSVAYIRGLAELRGRNADWAEKSVREALNVTASEALELNVINLVANDMEELLASLDGQTVEVNEDITVQLDLTDPLITVAERTWRDNFLEKITDPNIAYILLMVGIYALIFEFYSPGVGIGAVIGVITLLIAAYALQMLPVNYVGLLLLVLGLGLMATEAFVPSYGIFAIGGVVSFGFGSLLLFDDEFGGFGVSMGLVVGVAISTGLVTFYTLTMALRQRRRLATTGSESLIGKTAVVMSDFEKQGKVRLGGEIWNAVNSGSDPLQSGSEVTIESVENLNLTVKQES